MTVFFPQGIAQFAEANVSVKRLEKFMLFDETEIAKELWTAKNETIRKNNEAQKSSKNYPSNRKRSESVTTPIQEHDEDISDEEAIADSKPTNGISNGVKNTGIVLKEAYAKWTSQSAEQTLSNINLTVTPGRLVAVIGPVGSGKTSLLHAILKELPLSSGSLSVKGNVSYASQEPWLFAGTVRSNILFGLPMDRRRYREVVKRCALERDFTLFPYGDKTIVGDRGVSLSGGQRARINLARAVYRDADIYLLDDPLSAVDSHVGKHLFENCISSYLRDKVCILVTHQLQYLKEVDQIVILNNGSIEAEGHFEELRATGLDFASLLQEESGTEVEELGSSSEMISSDRAYVRQGSVQSIVSSIEESKPEAPAVEDEQRATGSVGGYVYKSYFKNGGNCFVISTLIGLFILAQGAASGGDYFITYWVNLEEQRQPYLSSGTDYQVLNKTIESKLMPEPGSFWDFSTVTCIYIFSAITAATVVVSLIRSFCFFNVCMRSSINLHNGMFNSITRAPMRFFNTNSSGRILNRFSKDMGAIDELLPNALIDCLQIGLALIGIIIVIAIVNVWLLLPTAIIGFIFYLIRIFYLSTSRSVKRLEGTSKFY